MEKSWKNKFLDALQSLKESGTSDAQIIFEFKKMFAEHSKNLALNKKTFAIQNKNKAVLRLSADKIPGATKNSARIIRLIKQIQGKANNLK